jgi:hypothetical protein
MKILQPLVILLILVLTAGFIVGCISPNTATTVSQTVASVSVSTTPVQVSAAQISVSETTIPAQNDASARKVASNTFVPVTIPTTPPLAMIYSESWIRSCNPPTGFQQFYQHIVDEDTGHWSITYQECSGAFHSSSGIVNAVEYNSSGRYRNVVEQNKSGNQSIEDAFNIMINAQDSVLMNTNYTTIEQNKTILNSAFKKAVSLLSKDGDSGEFLNTPVTVITDLKIIEGIIGNDTQSNELITGAYGVRCYSQYSGSYEIRTCTGPSGTHQQWIYKSSAYSASVNNYGINDEGIK